MSRQHRTTAPWMRSNLKHPPPLSQHSRVLDSCLRIAQKPVGPRAERRGKDLGGSRDARAHVSQDYCPRRHAEGRRLLRSCLVCGGVLGGSLGIKLGSVCDQPRLQVQIGQFVCQPARTDGLPAQFSGRHWAPTRGFRSAARHRLIPTVGWFIADLRYRDESLGRERWRRVLQVKHGCSGSVQPRRSLSTTALRGAALLAHCHRRSDPGTRPSGMNTTMSTKIAPSMKFQCST